MQIMFEDRHLIVLVKPAGVSSEETQPGGMDSVPNMIRAHLENEKAYVGVVHRLDAGVSGVMVYAKTPKAAAALSQQVQDGRFRKEYLCLCAGIPEPCEGEMRDYLFKDSRQGKVFPVKKERKGAKEALLDYCVLDTSVLQDADKTEIALCRIQLRTGRTHQIRVQFASRKHPLLGDGKYGSRVKGAIALRCAKITFVHPADGKEMEFSANAPEEWLLR